MYVDTHCHLNHKNFDGDRAAVRERAWNAQVRQMLCIGYDEASSARAVALAQVDAAVFAAIGIHPDAGAQWRADAQLYFRALFADNSSRISAYGEIGLDYHWNTLPHPAQQDVFAAQIAFAQSLSPTLPLIIHCREAPEDTHRTAQTDILSRLRESGTAAPVVMHCFTGDWDSARACLEADCFLGIGGVATFKKSVTLREAIAQIPLERLLLETDCPYLAPQPWRGKRNEPAYLPAVAQTIADTKQIPLETVAAVTTATAQALFRMP